MRNKRHRCTLVGSRFAETAGRNKKLKLEAQEQLRWWKLPTLNSKAIFGIWVNVLALICARLADCDKKEMANTIFKYV